MTPDTTALRAQADEAAAFRRLTPNWHRFRPEAGSVLVDPDTVRALCDAADEVERLRGRLVDATAQIKRMATEHLAAAERAQVEIERLRKAVWASEEIDRRAGMLAGAEGERDASRTSHAALIAELRALFGEHWDWKAGRSLHAAVTALLDRHAPTTGATP